MFCFVSVIWKIFSGSLAPQVAREIDQPEAPFIAPPTSRRPFVDEKQRFAKEH